MSDVGKDQTDHANKLKSSEHSEATPAELPELTDGFVQTLGDFKTVQEFKDKVRENILLEKENESRAKKANGNSGKHHQNSKT